MNEILKSIKRTPYQSLAIFLILFFTLFLSTIIFISLTFFYSFLNYVETRPQVTVYFQNKASTEQIFKLRDELVSSGKVLSIKYISKEEAFKIYKDLNKDNPLLLEMVTSDILPASLEIYAKKPLFLPEIAEYLKKQPGVDEVVFQKDIVNQLITITNVLRITAILFFGFLMFMTIVILIVITSFKVALKKDEIHLLQLLGATKSYVRAPFLKEAAFFGTVSSILSFTIIALTLIYFNPFLSSYLRGIPTLAINLYFTQLIVWPINLYFMLTTLVLSLIFGIFISTGASYLAIKKYLR
jgi:cell division transport system permease protein